MVFFFLSEGQQQHGQPTTQPTGTFGRSFFKENPVKHIRALLDNIMIIQGTVRPVKVLSGSLQGHWAPPQRLFQGSFSPHHHYFVSSPTSWVMTTTITIQPQEILPNARKLCSAESQVHFTMWMNLNQYLSLSLSLLMWMNLNRYLSQPPNRPEASETPWAASTQLDLAEVIFVLPRCWRWSRQSREARYFSSNTTYDWSRS